MYRQFALVIAATALISAVNAVTLKPTQCALWLRADRSEPRKNIFFRCVQLNLRPRRSIYVRLIRRDGAAQPPMVFMALVLVALAGWGLTKVPTGFIPAEDQGYLMVAVQVPDGASLERTEKRDG